MDDAAGGLIGILFGIALAIAVAIAIAYIAFFACAAIAGIGTIIFSFVILKNYGQAINSCINGKLPGSINESPTPPEPAYKSYFFRKAYVDLIDIITAAHEANKDDLKNLQEKLQKYKEGFGWVLVIGSYIAIAISGLGSFLLFTAISLIHASIIVLVCLVAYIVALYLRVAELISKKYRSITFECPKCYNKIGLLVYSCPNCGVKHKSLIPGQYGVFFRRCQCGVNLPTFDLMGRSKLEKFCPHPDCDYNIRGDEAKTVHISIIGGPSTGKSNFMVAMLSEFIDDARKHGRIISFPYKTDESKFERAVQGFAQGVPVDKTQERAPKSFNIIIEEPNGYKHNLYLYDAAGELYGQDEEDKLRSTEFLKRTEGILFIIDPFSIPEIRMNFNNEDIQSAGSSIEDPHNVLERFIQYIERNRQLNWRKIPISIVVNKTDQLGSFAIKGDVKAWLYQYGLGSFINTMENHFDEIKYYESSALGHPVKDRSAFMPHNVMHPLKDILETRKVEVVGAAGETYKFKTQGIGNAIGLTAASLIFLMFFFTAYSFARPHIRELHGKIDGNVAIGITKEKIFSKVTFPVTKNEAPDVWYKIDNNNGEIIITVNTTGIEPNQKQMKEIALKNQAFAYLTDHSGVSGDRLDFITCNRIDDDPEWAKKNFALLSSQLPFKKAFGAGKSYQYSIASNSDQKIRLSLVLSGAKQSDLYPTIAHIYNNAYNAIKDKMIQGTTGPQIEYELILKNKTLKFPDYNSFEKFVLSLFLERDRKQWNSRILDSGKFCDSVDYFGKYLSREAVTNKYRKYWKNHPYDQEQKYDNLRIIVSSEKVLICDFDITRMTDYTRKETIKIEKFRVELERQKDNSLSLKIKRYAPSNNSSSRDETENSEISSVIGSDQYLVITGCFKGYSNSHVQKKNLERDGFSTTIVNSSLIPELKPNFFVCISGNYDLKEDAKKRMDFIKRKGFDVYVKKVKKTR